MHHVRADSSGRRGATGWSGGSPLVAVLCALAGLGTEPAAAAPQTTGHPNVLVILSDDQGWGDVHSHGNPGLDTPVLDRLARAGARFEHFYVSPVCAPTRAALLTGRYALRTGVHGVTRGRETMRAAETTLAEHFVEAGYATGLFGKWHNGAHYPHDPIGQGFQEFFGFAAGHWSNYFDTTLIDGDRPVETRGYIADLLTDRAIDFVRRHSGRPFLCFVSYNTPHSPFQVPDRYFEKYRRRGYDPRTAAIYGMVENLDDNTGRLLAALREAGLEERTIVLFLTDNGPDGERFNGGLRGTKGGVDEGAVRVPLFVRWPGRIEAGRVVREHGAHVDLLPTLLELAGLPPAEGVPIDGVSLAPRLLAAVEPPPSDRLIFTQWAGNGAVRSARWRAVLRGPSAPWELYDMWSDPTQGADVAALEPEQTAHLSAAYDAWYQEVLAGGLEPIPVEIGHPEAPRVELPGHEAHLEGAGITYAGGASGWANDWITGWSDRADHAAWLLRAVEPGQYEVALLYRAEARQLGSRFRATLGGGSVEAEIDEAFDPPRVLSPDRVPRKEVDEHRWAERTLGVVSVDAGVTRLVLQATRIVGNRAPDVKAVRLRRLDPSG
jgi:arylsulfatase A-like enzyme